jgi:4-hydroxy-tetrahydrodipicolinate synthase
MTADVVTALVTPFSFHPDPAGVGSIQVNERSWKGLVAFQRDSGIPAVAVAGRIGEGASLSRWERKRLVETAVEASGPMQVLADVSGKEPGWSETLAMDAETAGAHGVVLRAPSSYGENVAAVRRLVERVSLAIDIPVHFELSAAHSGCRLTPCEVSKLARIDGVAGLIGHSTEPRWAERFGVAGKPMTMLSADEASCVASRMFGAGGFFSAVANVAPVEILRMHAACLAGDFDNARCIHERLLPLVLAVRGNAITALKHAVSIRHCMEGAVRPPLRILDRRGRTRVEEAMASSLLGSADRRVAVTPGEPAAASR